MATATKTVTDALFAAAGRVDDVTALCNEVVPEEIPENGLIIVRDPNIDDEIEVLGGFRETGYQATYDVELYYAAGDRETRDNGFDELVAAFGAVLEADLTLGGAVSSISFGAPETSVEEVQGGDDIKSGTISVTVEYLATTPLG